jgi:hypothetical protein
VTSAFARYASYGETDFANGMLAPYAGRRPAWTKLARRASEVW